MDIPSRRAKKRAGFGRKVYILFLSLLVALIIAFMVFVAVNTGNYMGLAAFFVLLFFLSLGLNIGNVRRFMPGLSSEHTTAAFPAMFVYICLGFMALAMASRLPNSHDMLSVKDSVQVKPEQKQSFSKTEDNTPPRDYPHDNALPLDSAKVDTPPSVSQADSQEPTAPVTKLDAPATEMVVTEIVGAHVIKVNNRQLVRLIGIQVPLSLQEQAAAFLQTTLINRQVSLQVCAEQPLDEDGRTRAVVTADDINVNLMLIEAGYSPLVVSLPSSVDFASWQSAENSAKQQKRGIWAKHPE